MTSPDRTASPASPASPATVTSPDRTAPPARQPGQPGQPGDGDKPGQDGQPGQPGQPGDGDKPGQDGQPGQPGEGNKPGEGDKPGTGQGGYGASASGDNPARPIPEDVTAARADLLRDAAPRDPAPTYSGHLGTAGLATDRATSRWWIDGQLDPGRYRPHYFTAREVARAVPAVATADAFRRSLRSADTVHVSRRLQAGRLDRRAMARAALGRPDAFQTRTEAKGLKTAVLFMVDGSSSMNKDVTVSGILTTRWQATLGTLAVMLPALDRAGAENAALVFGGNSTSQDGAARGKTLRWVKPWGGKARTDAMLDLVSGTKSHGGTPMIRQARTATRMLQAQRVSRRVCVWLCDGDPGEDRDAVAATLDAGRRAGVEHVGIGLQVGVAGVFGQAHAATVHDLRLLPAALRAVLAP